MRICYLQYLHSRLGIGTIETSNIVSNPLLMMIQQTLPDQFNNYFGPGRDLEGYLPSGQIEINGVTVGPSVVNTLFSRLVTKNIRFSPWLLNKYVKNKKIQFFHYFFLFHLSANKIAATKVKGRVNKVVKNFPKLVQFWRGDKMNKSGFVQLFSRYK